MYIGKDSSSLRPIWGIKEFSFVTSKISFEIGPSQHLAGFKALKIWVSYNRNP